MRDKSTKKAGRIGRCEIQHLLSFSFVRWCFKGLLIGILFLLVYITAGCESQGGASQQAINDSSATLGEEDLLRQLGRKFENPEIHCKLGQLYNQQRRFTKAEYHFKTALEFDPVYRPAQAAMVKMLLDSGDKTRGQLQADAYMKQASATADDIVQLGYEFEKQKLEEYAFSCYQKALEISPDSSIANKRMGYYYLSKSDKDQAEHYLTQSFRANPNQPDVAFELGRLGVTVEVPKAPSSSSNSPQAKSRAADKAVNETKS